MILRLALVLTFTVVSSGCLTMHTSHTLTLEADGSVHWAVLATDVRSDANDASERDREELAYLGDVTALTHDHARGLDELSPVRLDARILRDRRPFVVWTEARFDSVDALARGFFEQLGCRADVVYERDGATAHLRVLVSTTSEEDVVTAVPSLIGDALDYRIVLAEGRFISAQGFVLQDGGRVAVPSADGFEKAAEAGGPVELSLRWSVGG